MAHSPDLDAIGVPELRRDHALAGGDPDHRQVRRGVRADDLPGDLLLVVEPDRDLVRSLDDVEVRQDVSLRVDDDPRADARALPLPGWHLTEVLVEVLLEARGAPGPGAPPRGRWRRRKCAVAMFTTAGRTCSATPTNARWISAGVAPAARVGGGTGAPGQRRPESWSPSPMPRPAASATTTASPAFRSSRLTPSPASGPRPQSP